MFDVKMLIANDKNEINKSEATPFFKIDTALEYNLEAKKTLKLLTVFDSFEIIEFDFRVSKIVNKVNMNPETVIPIDGIT
tara:strand:- start:7204 stop:7443 length:240 start_codon:yes stop_codon:yes gene_type:complete